MPTKIPSNVFVLFLCTVIICNGEFAIEQSYGDPSLDDNWEPHIACGANSMIYMASTYFGPPLCPTCPTPQYVYRISSNNGLNWSDNYYMSESQGIGEQYDPVLQVAKDTGQIFAVWMDDWNISVTTSTSAGIKFTPPTRLAPSGALDPRTGADKPWVTSSYDGRIVFVFFNYSPPQKSPGLPYFALSLDYGQTWQPSQLIDIPSDGNYFFACGALTASNGVVFSPQSSYPQSYNGPINHTLLYTTDIGKSWHISLIATSEQGPPCPPYGRCQSRRGFLSPQSSVALDSHDILYALFTLSTVAKEPSGLYFSVSTDLGVTWSPRTNVSTASNSTHHGFPMIAATGNGDVRIAWFDNRLASDRYNVWYRQTNDSGKTWTTEERISNLQTSTIPYKDGNGFFFPYGDYGGVCIDSNGKTHVTWGEGTSWEGPGGTWYNRQL